MIALKGVETDTVTVQNKTTLITPENITLYFEMVHGDITDYGIRIEGFREDIQGR